MPYARERRAFSQQLKEKNGLRAAARPQKRHRNDGKQRNWDDKTGFRHAELFTEFNRLTAFEAADKVRWNALPQSADAYKPELPKDFQIPQGVEFAFKTDDPLMAQAKTLFHDIQTGKVSGQEAFSKMLGLYAGALIADQQSINGARNAEIAKLGATGTSRINAIETFWKSFLGEDMGKQINARILTAADVAIHEQIITKLTNQGSATLSAAHRDVEQPQGVLPAEQVDRMSARERLDYARQFDQSKMPAWRDPRTA